MRIALQSAFILHTRPYHETSLLVDVLTEAYGRISLVARGIRKNHSKLRPLLQPFRPLLLSWQGKSELMTLVTAESQGLPVRLQANYLLSAFYLNELLMRLLPQQDPHPELYTLYQSTLLELQNQTALQKTLRLFEKKLLAELGYALQLNMSIVADKYYGYYPEQGFKRWDEAVPKSANVFLGKVLLAFAAEQFEEDEVLRDIKRLMRLAFSPLLGPKPLQSRKLFVEVETE